MKEPKKIIKIDIVFLIIIALGVLAIYLLSLSCGNSASCGEGWIVVFFIMPPLIILSYIYLAINLIMLIVITGYYIKSPAGSKEKKDYGKTIILILLFLIPIILLRFH